MVWEGSRATPVTSTRSKSPLRFLAFWTQQLEGVLRAVIHPERQVRDGYVKLISTEPLVIFLDQVLELRGDRVAVDWHHGIRGFATDDFLG